ncbi:nitrate regulatory gene2 protein isoform X2 [Magnolia sinica]|uniref:nitrate regulatory gene2 protein isoform X2 n=1 Tax=Magnolia sinica TaxID=86752 RepID=UPI002659F1CD|nr:nitrate regulatory gene2 protein isoform X2 [Magnolia sinica]
MGVSSSKMEDDKALLLCRERRRFVRQALDGRCSLAAAHVSYIQSLKNTGTALRKFVEPEAPIESSLYTSTSATPEPLALTDKSLSQFSYSSPSMSQHIETVEALSPAASPTHSGRFHINHMRARRTWSATVEERAPVPVTATVQSSSGTPQNCTPRSVETPSFEPPPSLPEGTPPWDYFGLFDNQFSFQDGSALNHGLENTDDITRLREEEGIPDLEEEGERVAFIRRSEYLDSDEEFSEPSTNPSLQRTEKQSEGLNSYSPNSSPMIRSIRSLSQQNEHVNGEKNILEDDVDEAGETETPDMTPPSITIPSVVTLPTDEKKQIGKEPRSENKLVPKDFLSSIKEIEYLFIKASESGNEVPRMLEAKKVQFRPIVSEAREPAANAVKYLTWHRSASSRSSSSRIPLGANLNGEIADSSSSIFGSVCMNSGSHASTLDRLYAWERKLYDEVKASGTIRREYDMKCKMLRQQESMEGNPMKIGKTRAVVKDLHSRIRVAIHRIDTISKKIEELRDKELQPQLEELIEGLSRMWEMMLETHKLQLNIISIAYNNGSLKVSVLTESHRQASVHLEYEFNSLCSSFMKWVDAQKAYVNAINKWLLKCVFPLQRKHSRRRKLEFSPRRDCAPPIFVTCRDWLVKLDKLPANEVAFSINDLVAVMARFAPRQEKKIQRRNSSSSFSWKPNSGSKTGADGRNGVPQVDWNSGFQALQSSLMEFFKQLNEFADLSVKSYAELQTSIKNAQVEYDRNAPQKKQS